MYDIEHLYEAKTVEEAVSLRLAHPDAVILAGGSDVLIKIRSGKLAGCDVISIYGIDALRGIHMEEDGTIVIGSLTSFSHITQDPIIEKNLRVLGEAVDKVGGPQIRAIGTIGGNTCNGVTSADSASTLLSYDAVVELTGPEGKRLLPLADFYLGPGKTDVREGEIQTSLRIPKESYEGHEGYYIKFGMRSAMEIATIGCSVNVALNDEKTALSDLRIAYGVAGPVPMRAKKTEEAFRSAELSYDTVKAIGESVLTDVHPRDSWRAPKNLREHLCRQMAEDALVMAVKRSGGTIAGMPESDVPAKDFLDITMFPEAGLDPKEVAR